MKRLAEWGLKRLVRVKSSTAKTTAICEETLHMRIGGGRSEVLDGEVVERRGVTTVGGLTMGFSGVLVALVVLLGLDVGALGGEK